MHFPIIKLEDADCPVEDFAINLSYEDSCLMEHTDYYGDIYDAEDRKRVIESDWLKDLLDGYATIDTVNETITFFDRDTCTKSFDNYLRTVTHDLNELAEDGKLTGYQLRMAGEKYKDCDALFYKDYGSTSFDFIDDAKYYANTTFKIGNIFDAHF